MNILDSKIKEELEELNANKSLGEISSWHLHNSAPEWSEDHDIKFLEAAKNSFDDYSALFKKAMSIKHGE